MRGRKSTAGLTCKALMFWKQGGREGIKREGGPKNPAGAQGVLATDKLSV